MKNIFLEKSLLVNNFFQKSENFFENRRIFNSIENSSFDDNNDSYYSADEKGSEITYIEESGFTDKKINTSNLDNISMFTDDNKAIRIVRDFKDSFSDAIDSRLSSLPDQFKYLGEKYNSNAENIYNNFSLKIEGKFGGNKEYIKNTFNEYVSLINKFDQELKSNDSYADNSDEYQDRDIIG